MAYKYTASDIDAHLKSFDVDLVKEINVVDVKRKHETHLKFEDMILNSGIEDKDFHEMNLKRIPLK